MSSCYLNNAFAKQPHAEVVDAMLPYLKQRFENPLTGSESAESIQSTIESSRKDVASLLGSEPARIFFVSSGTEANNWALKGVALAQQKRKKHIVISAIEHFSIYQSAEYLSRQGWELTLVPVDSDGLLDLDALKRSILPSTALVSIQSASDEIGVIQDLDNIISLKRDFHDVVFHTDAIQYVCYETLDVAKHPFDLVSFSSNAIYGPAGIAALYVREGIRLVPLFHGGMQEDGLRPGFQSTALISGFGVAAKIARQKKDEWRDQLAGLQKLVFEGVGSIHASVTGSRKFRTIDNVHVSTDVDGEAVLTLLQSEGISASSGSTCYQYAQKESHVLKAIGLTPEQTRGSVLFTLGIDHDVEQIVEFNATFAKTLEHLRRVKP